MTSLPVMVVAGLIALATPVLGEPAPPLEFRTASERMVLGFQDIAAVAPEPEGYLSYLLDPEAGATFAAFTARNLGARLEVLVCGVQVLEVRIQAQIDSGVMIHAVEDRQQADAILAMVAGDADCPLAQYE